MTGKYQTQCEGEAKQSITVLIIKSVIIVNACFKLIIKCEKLPADTVLIIKSVIIVNACFKLIIKCEKLPANTTVIRHLSSKPTT